MSYSSVAIERDVKMRILVFTNIKVEIFNMISGKVINLNKSHRKQI